MELFKSEEKKLAEAQAARAGQLYEGPGCWCDDPETVPRPGFYALGTNPETGQEGSVILPHYPLVMVDDAPDDPEDGACHYEYAGPTDRPYRSGARSHADTGNIIEIEAHDAAGTSSISMGTEA